MKKFIVNEYLVLVYRFVIVMFIYSLCRILFYLYNTDLFQGITFSSFLTIMKGGLTFDLSALLYINLIYFLIALLPFPFRYKNGYQSALKYLYITLNAIGIAFNAIDFAYYPFILKRTTANVWDILHNETNKASLTKQFILDYWDVFFIWIGLIALLLYLYNRVTPKISKYPYKWLTYPVSLLALIIFSVITIIGIRGGYRHSTRPITLSNAGEYVKSPEEVAIVLNTPFSIIRTIGKKSFIPYHYFNDTTQLNSIFTPVHQGSGEPMIKKNVVIILLESFSREHFGYFNKNLDNGTYKGYTPFLDSLSAHSLTFPNAFANGRKSIDALPSVTASLPALMLPYVLTEYSSNKINSLATLLGSQGYETAFYHGAPNGSMGFNAFTNLAGFKHYVGMSEFNNNAFYDGIWGIWDEEFFQFFNNQLTATKEPFFATIFSVSSHHPFEVPERYKNVYPKGHLPIHQCVGYTDNALREFFNAAKKTYWYNNTIFVITADHSTIAYHEAYKTNVNAFAVPLIFYTPDESIIGRRTDVAQQIDIMPTILHYLKYPESYIAFGNDLLNNQAPRFAINSVGENYQFIRNDTVTYFNGLKTTGIYSMITDPMLQKSVLGNHLNNDDEQIIKAFVQQYNNRMIENKLTSSANKRNRR